MLYKSRNTALTLTSSMATGKYRWTNTARNVSLSSRLTVSTLKQGFFMERKML